MMLSFATGEASGGVHGLQEASAGDATANNGVLRAQISGKVLRRGSDLGRTLGKAERSKKFTYIGCLLKSLLDKGEFNCSATCCSMAMVRFPALFYAKNKRGPWGYETNPKTKVLNLWISELRYVFCVKILPSLENTNSRGEINVWTSCLLCLY